MAISPRSIRPEVVVSVRIPSMDKIDSFKHYSYLIGPCEKVLRNKYTKM